jgi:hypothetical protein
MSRRNTRRCGPTTMRTVGAHEVGAPPPKSGRQMQREINERYTAAVIRKLVEETPDLGHAVQLMVKQRKTAVEILAALRAAK